MKRLLSLYDLTGNWSAPYREAGWFVLQIDKELGIDILDWDYRQYPPDFFDGILIAQPCTAYALSGARYWPKKDADGTTAYFNRLTYRSLEIVAYFNRVWWCLENPVGRIAKCVPELKKYRLSIFDPCDFGDPYTKKTVLYGWFNPLFLLNRVPVIAAGGNHSVDAFLGIKSNGQHRASARSATPLGFARAFYEANH